MTDDFKMKYNFGKHYSLNPQIDSLGNPVNNLVQKIQVSMKENLEDAVCDAIAKEAQAQGFTDLFVLDKKRIMSALQKQIPKKPIKKNPIIYQKDTDGQEHYAYDYHCPLCGKKIKLTEHHCICGQAIDWSE